MNEKNILAAKLVLPGAVCGDTIGSWYEFQPTKDYDFQMFHSGNRFTDDTVCTMGIADALINNEPYADRLKNWGRRYSRRGYGGMFRKWILSDSTEPYNSWGNGSAMRVSSVGAFANSEEEVLRLAKETAEVTHNHPEGIKGAQATALAIYLALHGKSKAEIKDAIETRFDYDLSRKYEDIKRDYVFEVSCQKSVPESIICFLESTDYESTIRKAIALGGDADTMACIAGGIAAAYYGEIPKHILEFCEGKLTEDIKEIMTNFGEII